MAVDKQILEKCIRRASKGNTDLAAMMTSFYGSDEAAAVDFVGGFMAGDDYTRKTQELAEERKTYAGTAEQLKTLRAALTAAETEKNTIMRDLATNRVSVAKARELMKILGDKYQLTDEDLPGMSELIETRKSGKVVDDTPSIDERLAAAKKDWMAEAEQKFSTALIPELGAMATLPIIWNEISREHQDLTGKPLSFAEQQEIYKTARDGKIGLRDAWEQKYNVGGDTGLRMQKRDERLKSEWAQEREKADAARLSAEALNVVTPKPFDVGTGRNISSAFQTKFKTFEMDPMKPAEAQPDGVPALKVEPGQHVRQSGAGRQPAAQRAAVKYMERMSQGGYGKKTA